MPQPEAGMHRAQCKRLNAWWIETAKTNVRQLDVASKALPSTLQDENAARIHEVNQNDKAKSGNSGWLEFATSDAAFRNHSRAGAPSLHDQKLIATTASEVRVVFVISSRLASAFSLTNCDLLSVEVAKNGLVLVHQKARSNRSNGGSICGAVYWGAHFPDLQL